MGTKPSAADGTAQIVIGATPNTSNLPITGKGNSTGFINPQLGGTFQGNNFATWSQTSDIRIKKNVTDNSVGLDKVKQIQVRNFEYKLPEEISDGLAASDAIQITGTQVGVIAQEIETIFPDFITDESTGCKTVNHDNLTWYLVNSVKELLTKIEAAETRITTLEG